MTDPDRDRGNAAAAGEPAASPLELPEARRRFRDAHDALLRLLRRFSTASLPPRTGAVVASIDAARARGQEPGDDTLDALRAAIVAEYAGRHDPTDHEFLDAIGAARLARQRLDLALTRGHSGHPEAERITEGP